MRCSQFVFDNCQMFLHTIRITYSYLDMKEPDETSFQQVFTVRWIECQWNGWEDIQEKKHLQLCNRQQNMLHARLLNASTHFTKIQILIQNSNQSLRVQLLLNLSVHNPGCVKGKPGIKLPWIFEQNIESEFVILFSSAIHLIFRTSIDGMPYVRLLVLPKLTELYLIIYFCH